MMPSEAEQALRASYDMTGPDVSSSTRSVPRIGYDMPLPADLCDLHSESMLLTSGHVSTSRDIYGELAVKEMGTCAHRIFAAAVPGTDMIVWLKWYSTPRSPILTVVCSVVVLPKPNDDDDDDDAHHHHQRLMEMMIVTRMCGEQAFSAREQVHLGRPFRCGPQQGPQVSSTLRASSSSSPVSSSSSSSPSSPIRHNHHHRPTDPACGATRMTDRPDQEPFLAVCSHTHTVTLTHTHTHARQALLHAVPLLDTRRHGHQILCDAL
eukprot:1222563-Rhodomonas_salina.2